MVALSTLDDLFSSALRGCRAPWPQEWASEEALAAAERRLLFHGIAGLLNQRPDLLDDWPTVLRDRLRQESLARAIWELRHATLLAAVVSELHHVGVRSALLKGTALAYSHYDEPGLRFRGDSDLLVSPRHLPLVRSVLAELGWQRPGHGEGPFGDMHYQELWQFFDPAGLTHDIDLHWEVTNSRALRRVLDVDNVLNEAVGLPALSPYACAPDPVTAIIHRAVNRAEHARSGYFSLDRNEFDPNRLLWAKDIALLASDLSELQWGILTERALDSGIGWVVWDALSLAIDSLGITVPEQAARSLRSAPRTTPETRFLTARSDLERYWADFKATPGFWPRTRFVLARALPSPRHMREKYPQHANWPLAALYGRRFLDVARSRMTRDTF